MSYKVLASKYRPKNFDTLVGQDHVVQALTHSLKHNRLHHSYLFTGTRGVGKTTLSRILAKSFNCIGENGKSGVTQNPCGICNVCLSIDDGRFVDYIEMDAASNRGVEEMGSMLEQAIYLPSYARFKVYVIDEVHMLSNYAFNAMLKTLEEPPKHVKFILATTDPQKIPVTVLSRCLQFNLKKMLPSNISKFLEKILSEEKISYEKKAVNLISHSSQGSMRDALSLADQAISYSGENITIKSVQDMLGTIDKDYLINLLEVLSEQNGSKLFEIIDNIASRNLSLDNILRDLGNLLTTIAIAQNVPNSIDETLFEKDAIIRLAEKFSPEEIQLFYQIAVHGKNELSLAPDEYSGFSMTILRMLAFKPIFLSSEKNNPTLVESNSEQNFSKNFGESVKEKNDSQDLKQYSYKDINNKEKYSPPNINTLKEKNIIKLDNMNNINWPDLVDGLSLIGASNQLAIHSELINITEKNDILSVFLKITSKSLFSSLSEEKLSSSLENHFKKKVNIFVEIGNVTNTAYSIKISKEKKQQLLAEQSMQNDPFIKKIMADFGAKIIPGSVKSI